MSGSRHLSLVATMVLSAVYFYLGTRPQNPEVLQSVPDKVIHAGAYGLLGAVASGAAASMALTPAPLIGWVYAVAHGALLEVVQHFTPPRSAEVGDVLSDAFGAAAGVAVWVWWRRRR